MPLKSKLIFLFFAFTLIPLVLFGAIVFSQARNILKTVRMAQLDTIADLKKDKIETFFQEREADVRSAQDFRNIRTNLPVLSTHAGDRTAPAYVQAKKSLDDQMKTFQESYGYLDVMLLDPLGKVVYASNDEHSAVQLGKPLHDKKFFEEGKKGIYFTDVFFDTEGDRHVEMIGIAPVRDLQGGFVGAVALEIDMAPIFKFVQDTTGLGTTGEALIARKEGNETLFLSPLQHEPNAALKKVVSLQEKIAVPAIKAAGGENGSGITYDYHGEEVLAAWRYMPFLRWGLVTKIDASEVFAPVRKLRVLVIFIGIFIVLIGALVALAIARAITGPILSLQKGAEAIAAGDLSHRVGTIAQDEVGRLSRAFDAMTDAIDRRVRERTIELENAVAERKQAEKILKLSNAYNRSLLEASLDPLVTIDAGGKITDVNIATEQVTGCSRLELIGTDFSDYFTEPERAKAGYQQVFQEGSVMDYALEIRRRDGHVTPVLYNAAVYNDDGGNIIGVFAAARDITERRRAEEIAKLDDARTDSILRISQYPAASLGELLDFALDEAIALSGSKFGYLYFYHEDTQDFILHAWSKDVMAECTIANPQTDYKLEKTGIWGEVVRQRKPIIVNDFAEAHPLKKGYPEGHAPLLRFFSVPVFSEGHIVAVVGFANRPAEYTDRDVSHMTLFMDSVWKIVERKQAEEEIKKLNQELEARVIERTAELENINKELEAFAYSVSHDLRTPLRSIEGFSLALLEDYVDRLDDTGKSYLTRVRGATMRMGHLIDDLLKLSRVTRSEMNREQVDLSVIGKDIAGRLAESHPERSAEFIIVDGLTTYGDARLLTVALENLFSNAWKFSEKAARSVIEFGVTHRDDAEVFYVKDNGVGFNMAYADKLFSPFQRLHRLEEFTGTGIGLATVKRIINRHGGRVWIESEENKGTTVYFML
jgi:PAS domain S-box-containing protein